MNYLRTAPFGGLFTVTFSVAAAFQIAFALLGLLLAVLSPGLFQMNGEPATSPAGAIGVLLFLLVFILIVNAGMSALGAVIVLAVRRVLPTAKTS
ncbi:hypothetical protein E4M02_09410 [Brevundimonas sp. S30B]|uniref:hypothetical protein n=1 Tax=unclassified Brevundimonas TaxID=2622653 RepID=UPI0010718F07|nr:MULTISPECIES: hypothetical protein [unclassified Brevundimonas]QBX38561.1 hypothetical protein E4M01_12840 [Brevundimonas sp. MF30-B]TFW00489.1 hypothetical protein E4M02_14375 [Brevundimonas sp. S30B]TFW01864.1 hypothetical protein E4M02_09410 [Brevundimonas sp. S30B]